MFVSKSMKTVFKKSTIKHFKQNQFDIEKNELMVIND